MYLPNHTANKSTSLRKCETSCHWIELNPSEMCGTTGRRAMKRTSLWFLSHHLRYCFNISSWLLLGHPGEYDTNFHFFLKVSSDKNNVILKGRIIMVHLITMLLLLIVMYWLHICLYIRFFFYIYLLINYSSYLYNYCNNTFSLSITSLKYLHFPTGWKFKG